MPSKGNPAEWIEARLRPGQKAVDVGAAGGSLTRLMARHVGETGRVWALEPDPVRTGVDSPQVTWLPVAAWSERTRRPFYCRGEQSSFWRDLAGGDAVADVACDTLDTLVPERVDLIKVDTQGSEVKVLEGAVRHLQEGSIWILELWPRGLTVAGSSALALSGLLRSHGYDVYWAEPGCTLVSEDALSAWVERSSRGFINIVAVRGNLPPL